jgi:hypothetical protein
VNRVAVVPGISLPFFPPRPVEGQKIKGPKDLNFKELAETYVIQAKLNGDRATALVLAGKVFIQNRHGSWFKHPVENQQELLKLPDRTVLDGEVWKKKFYPFEAVVIGGDSFMLRGPELRVQTCVTVCQHFKLPYIFSWENAKVTDEWEGYVFKEKGTPYLPLGSESQTTQGWWKRKWI